MGIKVEDHIDVRSQAESLGLPEPSGLKFLPRNFAKAKSVEDFEYPDSVIDVQRLLIAEGVDVARIDANRTPVRVIEHSNEWTVPVIWASVAAFQHAHPDLVRTITSTIQTQAKRIFRGVIGATNVKMEIVLDQPGRGSKKVSFEGPTEELPKLEELLNKMLQEGAKDDGGRVPEGG